MSGALCGSAFMADFNHHAAPYRDGITYDHARDGKRLHNQQNRVFALMKDGVWRSLSEIAASTGDPEASTSSRLRDFRKDRFQALYGPWRLESKNEGGGKWKYRLIRVGQAELM